MKTLSIQNKFSLFFIAFLFFSVNSSLFGQTIQIVDNNVNNNPQTTLHGFCTGPNFTYDVYWDDTTGPAVVEVVNTSGTVLASGTTSPIRDILFNNSTTATLDIQVREQGNITNISSVVAVERKNCAATEIGADLNYNASGVQPVYSVPAGVTHIRASVIGGGGNGSARQGGGATAGGAGADAAISVFAVSESDSYTVTVGAGRGGGSSGAGRGGSSTITDGTNIVLATGGQGRGQGFSGTNAGGVVGTTIGDVRSGGQSGNTARGGAAGDFIDQSTGGGTRSGNANAGFVAGGGGTGRCNNCTGNGGSGARGSARIETFNSDVIAPTVTVEQAAGQLDPALITTTAKFTVTFSEPINISSLTCDDVFLSGTATANCTGILEVGLNDGTTFEISVTATSTGTVITSLPAASVHDLAGNNNEASTSTDNSVTIMTAPGGVATDLSLWLKADAGVFTDNTLNTLVTTDGTDNAGTWVDQSGNGFIADRTAVGSEANYVTNGANFNPVVKFDEDTSGSSAIGDGMTFTTNLITTTDIDVEVYYVINNDDDTNGANPILLNEGAGNNRFYLFNDGVRFGNVSNQDLTVSPEQYLISARHDTALDVSISNINAGTDQSRSGAWTVIPPGPFRLGSSFSSSNDARRYDGDIAEVIIYETSHTSTERQQIQSYLALKYGITLDQTTATDYLASDGTTIMWDASENIGYTNDIAGIGLDDDQALNQRVSKSVNSDALVAFALDNNFTAANNDVARTVAHAADLSFMTWANDDAGITAWTATGAPTDREILDRVWKTDETGTVGTVYLSIPDNSSCLLYTSDAADE